MFGEMTSGIQFGAGSEHEAHSCVFSNRMSVQINLSHVNSNFPKNTIDRVPSEHY